MFLMNKTSDNNSVYDYIKMLKTGGCDARLFSLQIGSNVNVKIKKLRRYFS